MTDAAAPTRRPAVLIKPVPILFGLLAGLGVAVLLQQYAVTPLTIPLLVGMAILGAAVMGIGLPTLLLYVMRPKADEKEVPK